MMPRHLNARMLAMAAVLSLALVAAGAFGMWLALGERPAGPASPTSDVGAVAADAAGPRATIAVTIAPDLIARAGIETAEALSGHATEELRVPAVVEPNAYREVVVVATAGGEVLNVPVELGDRVTAGASLVRLHSPEIAAAEREYLSVLADLDAASRQVARLERLVAIGGASRQELEAAQAVRAGLAADRDSIRARLQWFGRDGARVSALEAGAPVDPVSVVRSAVGGTVTARPVTAGRTVDAGAPLVTIVDLSTVWVIGDVYERDLGRIGLGSPVTLSSAAFPGETLAGRVSYIDPEVARDTRTVRVRAELPNPARRLRLGMLMDMRVDGPVRETILVPATAVQTIGDRQVVYVADAATPGRFIERSVHLGARQDDRIAVLAGVSAGERVVSAGSFYVRAERERRGLPPPADPPTSPLPPPARRVETPSAVPAAAAVVDIEVTSEGFVPAEVTVPADRPITLRFKRTADPTCATEVVFEALQLRRALPLGKVVAIDLPAQSRGTLRFSCGMNMFRGAVVIR